MHQPLPARDFLRDPALAPYAAGAGPVWLFDMDGTSLLFANPAAAALLGYPTSAAAAGEALPAGLAAQIEHVGATLTPDGGSRLARLRGLGLSLGRALTCACSVIHAGSREAILVRAVEETGPELPLPERARRLIEGRGAAIAAFGADGALLHATEEAAAQCEDGVSLADLKDRAEIWTQIWTLGEGDTAITLAQFNKPAKRQPDEPVDLGPIADAMASIRFPARANPEAPRRHPLRFVWESDPDNRFTIATEEFLDIAGTRTRKLLGRFWGEIAAKLALDPEGRIAQAMMSRDTWSGMPVQWPLNNGERVAVALSGIPAFGPDRTFLGYRGLGVLREPEAAPKQESLPQEIPQPDIAQPDSGVEIDDDIFAENVVPFRGAAEDRPHKAAALNPVERTAFVEIGSRLAARLKDADALARGDIAPAEEILPLAAPVPSPEREEVAERAILDRLPAGILIYRLTTPLYANTAFLKATGHASLGDFAQAGGLDSLFIEPDSHAETEGGQRLRVARQGEAGAIAGRLFTAPFEGEDAMVLLLSPEAAPEKNADTPHSSPTAILDIAADGVVTIDRDGRIRSANARAETLFGCEPGALEGQPFGSLFAPESERIASARLHRLAQGEEKADADDNREIIGRRRAGGLISLQLILGRAEGADAPFCAVFRDLTRWRQTEQELIAARQQAEKASNAKSDFLARISHEMRIPLNAILGFSEVMMEERFGAVGNERYRDYLKDIHTSGGHLVSLLNDLLDLSKIEAGKMELSFERVKLNELTQQTVALMQPQAAQARVVVRSALSTDVPDIIADPRSMRQIVLNLLSNSIKFTRAGGQVIVSTATNERGEVILRVRDTGIGMSEKDIEIALQPFRQLGGAPRANETGTGLGLPLTKALVEANRARFSIKSAVDSGTMVEIVFPAARVLRD